MSKIFSFVEIGERAGSGLPKIYDGWLACGLPLGRSRLVEALGLGPSRIKELLSGMVSQGLIVPEGSSRARVYRLPDEEDE